MDKIIQINTEGSRFTVLTDQGRIFQSYLDGNGLINWKTIILPSELLSLESD